MRFERIIELFIGKERLKEIKSKRNKKKISTSRDILDNNILEYSKIEKEIINLERYLEIETSRIKIRLKYLEKEKDRLEKIIDKEEVEYLVKYAEDKGISPSEFINSKRMTVNGISRNTKLHINDADKK